MLDDLRREAGIGFESCLKLLVLVLHLDRALPFCLSSNSNTIVVIDRRENGFQFLGKALP